MRGVLARDALGGILRGNHARSSVAYVRRSSTSVHRVLGRFVRPTGATVPALDVSASSAAAEAPAAAPSESAAAVAAELAFADTICAKPEMASLPGKTKSKANLTAAGSCRLGQHSETLFDRVTDAATMAWKSRPPVPWGRA